MISGCTLAILIPFWIGIAFNLVMTILNIACMGAGFDHSRFVDWYLEGNGGFKLMAGVWVALIAWSILAGVSACN